MLTDGYSGREFRSMQSFVSVCSFLLSFVLLFYSFAFFLSFALLARCWQEYNGELKNDFVFALLSVSKFYVFVLLPLLWCSYLVSSFLPWRLRNERWVQECSAYWVSIIADLSLSSCKSIKFSGDSKEMHWIFFVIALQNKLLVSYSLCRDLPRWFIHYQSVPPGGNYGETTILGRTCSELPGLCIPGKTHNSQYKLATKLYEYADGIYSQYCVLC